jgi:membrane associated rhomboid family serine protease
MIIPLRTDSRLQRTPYMNWALIALNILVFVAFQRLPGIGGNRAMMRGGDDVTTRFELSPYDPQIAAFVTYAFLHANAMHLLGNMLFLYIFGNNVNDKMGQLGYLAFYLAGGVFAGVAYVLMETAGAPVIGASGAISAVTGAYLVLFPRSNVTIFYFWYFFGTYEIPSLWFILFFFVKDLIFNFGGQDNVAHMAHLGGTVFGFTICVVLLSVRLLPRDQFDLVAMIKQWNRRRQYRDMVSKGYNPFEYGTRQRPGPPPPPDPRQEQIINFRTSALEAVGRHDLPTAAHLYLRLKEIDPQQVLPKQAQLDIANQLAGEQRFAEAADAYEAYLRVYPKAEQIEQIELMLGLIYARYLSNYERAKVFLDRAMLRLHDPSAQEMAREELARIQPLLSAQQT